MQDKISYEFADIIRQRLCDEDERFVELQEELDFANDSIENLHDLMDEIRSLVQNLIVEIEENSSTFSRRYIITTVEQEHILSVLNAINDKVER